MRLPPTDHINLDITFCATSADGCPFTDCQRHLQNLVGKKHERSWITIAELGGQCRDYIGYLAEEVISKEWTTKD